MASDLGLHCLPMSHKKDARLIWAKKTVFSEIPGSAKKVSFLDISFSIYPSNYLLSVVCEYNSTN